MVTIGLFRGLPWLPLAYLQGTMVTIGLFRGLPWLPLAYLEGYHGYHWPI